MYLGNLNAILLKTFVKTEIISFKLIALALENLNYYTICKLTNDSLLIFSLGNLIFFLGY